MNRKPVVPPTKAEILAFLRKITPFRELSAKSLKKLAEAAAPVKCRHKEVVFFEEQQAQYVWVLYSGRLGIIVTSTSGRRQEIEHIIPGEMFGTLCRLFSHSKGYPCTAEAVVDSVALRIPDGPFLESFKGSVEMMTTLCGLCADRLSKMKDLPRMAMEPPKARVAFAISKLLHIYGKKLPVKEKEIADIAGIAPETAYRTLHNFRETKLISDKPHQVLVLEPEKIHNLWREGTSDS